MAGFLDKVTGGISKGVANVGATSKGMMEKAKVKAVISNLEAEQKNLTQLLGQKAYELYKANGAVPQDDGVTNFVTEIDKRIALIEEQKEQLKRIEEEVAMVTKGTVRTSQEGAACQCGYANGDGAKFCANCGAMSTNEQASVSES